MKMFYFCYELIDVFLVCSRIREEKCDLMFLNRNSVIVYVKYGGMIVFVLDGFCVYLLQKNYIFFKL